MSGREVRRPHGRTPGNSIWRRRECKHALDPFRLGAQSMGTLAWAFTHFHAVPGKVETPTEKGIKGLRGFGVWGWGKGWKMNGEWVSGTCSGTRI